MSWLSRLQAMLAGRPASEQTTAAHDHASRHDRREAGRERHHETGGPAWDADDRLDPDDAKSGDPDAAPEILGGG